MKFKTQIYKIKQKKFLLIIGLFNLLNLFQIKNKVLTKPLKPSAKKVQNHC